MNPPQRIIYSKISGHIWTGGLGQAEPATSLTRAEDTVNLNAPLLPKLLTGGVLLGALYLLMKRMQETPRGFGPDGFDELATESRRIKRLVARSRSRSR